jgi:3D (Asp-Asp-Asp) domain-containing protein
MGVIPPEVTPVSNAWTNAVVVDPQKLRALADEISQLGDEISHLRAGRARHRRWLCTVAAMSLVASAALCLQSTRLAHKADEARHFKKVSQQVNAALGALTRSHDQILSATEQAPSVGTKSWGRRFTVTMYLPRSPAYGKDNDGFTATMVKADPEKRIIAVDPTLIPYGSWVWIEGLGWYQAQDCGSAIKGFRLDVLTATEDDAMRFGKQDRFVIVVPPGSAGPAVG